MTPEEQQLEAGIAVLEGQRDLLGDAIVESAFAPMRARRIDVNIAAHLEQTAPVGARYRRSKSEPVSES